MAFSSKKTEPNRKLPRFLWASLASLCGVNIRKCPNVMKCYERHACMCEWEPGVILLWYSVPPIYSTFMSFKRYLVICLSILYKMIVSPVINLWMSFYKEVHKMSLNIKWSRFWAFRIILTITNSTVYITHWCSHPCQRAECCRWWLWVGPCRTTHFLFQAQWTTLSASRVASGECTCLRPAGVWRGVCFQVRIWFTLALCGLPLQGADA